MALKKQQSITSNGSGVDWDQVGVLNRDQSFGGSQMVARAKTSAQAIFVVVLENAI